MVEGTLQDRLNPLLKYICKRPPKIGQTDLHCQACSTWAACGGRYEQLSTESTQALLLLYAYNRSRVAVWGEGGDWGFSRFHEGLSFS